MRTIRLMTAGILFLFLLVGCSEEDEKGKLVFYGHNDFLKAKDAWTEPDSYSFKYVFCFGDSVVLYPFSVEVRNGTGTVDFGEGETAMSDNNNYEGWFGDIVFESISEIYSYFDSCYEKQKKNYNDDYDITFSVKYKSSEINGCLYPVELNESRTLVKDYEVNGYGGVYIKVFDVAALQK